ncbi:unnamed protein product [Notodromas monacha]|uniref:Peptidase S1 domain-containing protein n=1 Tax=Notodromas monacha TaxID=399045 RepID=A0A7R9BS11_9CRUS|nr:unnamed protein product [Notodromas monacha]CAG0919563.1 unnamed protein product [Notodromas monacha]
MFPYQVAIFVEILGYQIFDCGGIIINENFFLTPAHCCDDFQTRTVKIQAGSTRLEDPDAVYIPVAETRSHPLYVGGEGNSSCHDICVVKLAESIPMGNPNIAIANFPTSSDTNYDGEIAVVSGWGLHDNYSETISQDLQYASIPLLSSQTCRQLFNAESELFCEKDICTGDQVGSNAPTVCVGDSGGPLTLEDTVIGIVSRNDGPMCMGGTPAIYTDISKYMEWVHETAKREGPPVRVSGQPPDIQFTVAHPPAVKRRSLQLPARAVLGLSNPQPTKPRSGHLIVGAPQQLGD